jgi:predicted GIY-YIG superfamily endonuclease
MFWTYLMFSDRGRFYIGQTADLPRRLAQHNSHENKRAVSHRMGKKWELIDVREFGTRDEALAFEARAKRARDRFAWIQENAERIKGIVKREKFLFPKELRHPNAQRYQVWR